GEVGLTPSAPTGGYSGRDRSLGRDALGRLLRNRLSVIGLTITLLFVFLAILGPVLAPYPYQQQDLRRTNELPSQDHWLGTDDLGRDFLSRVMWGGRTAIIVASFVTTIAVTLGVLLGGLGWCLVCCGGWLGCWLFEVA